MDAKSIRNRAGALKASLDDAVKTFIVADETSLQVDAWEQTFNDTNCGFPGVAGQALTRALVVSITHYHSGRVGVYIDGRRAYIVERPSEWFKAQEGSCHLEGQRGYEGEYEEGYHEKMMKHHEEERARYRKARQSLSHSD